MGKPHALVIPFPAQGHVTPLMELSNLLVEHGFKVTFVNTESIQKQVISALPKEKNNKQNEIHLVSIPDGMGPEEDRGQWGKLCDSMLRCMPRHLEELIVKINESNSDKITCFIADEIMGWAVKVAKKMGIPHAVLWPCAAAIKVLNQHIPKLIDEGIIDSIYGTIINDQMIKLSPSMLAMDTNYLVWSSKFDPILQQAVFQYMLTNIEIVKNVDWFLCNSFYEIEQPAFQLNPNLLPIGPLLRSNHLDQITGNFWAEDLTCFHWLEEQAPCSVIYVAFGSTTVFNERQFHELALGLDLTNQPFLWVVRPNLIDGITATYPWLDGFRERVGTRGRIVEWAPQKKVLGHRSIACFLTHCGWNSTMEGLSMGVPFLCWPYFADQFHNQKYISDVWKVGLKLNSEDNGIIPREEINKKVKDLLGDDKIRERALVMKEIARKSVSKEGSSENNFNKFIEAMKGN